MAEGKSGALSLIANLESLAQEAVGLAKKAKKHKQGLSGDNFYGNKLAALRADAVNHFRDLTSQSVGDTAALAELIETTFAARTASAERLQASRDMIFSLRTTWGRSESNVIVVEDGLFPLTLLVKADRGYLVTIGRQMNGCYSQGWYDASAVMMRRLIEIAIIEAYEKKGIAAKIKNADGDYVQLTAMIAAALSEPTLSLSRNAKKALPHLRDVGHMSAHGRFFLAQKSDLEKNQQGCRVVVEEFLHHAGLI